MSDSDSTGTGEAGAAALRDGSLRVDTRALSSEEQDFARLMGFGEEPSAQDAPEAPPAKKKPAVKPSPPPPAAAAPIVETAPPASAEAVGESPAVADPALSRPTASTEAGSASSPEPMQAAQPSPPPRVWEEIHPRAATLGRQSALLERADRILTLEAGGKPVAASADHATNTHAAGDDSAELRERLRAREARIDALEAEARELSDAVAARPELRAAATEPPPQAFASAGSVEKEIEDLQGEIEVLQQECDRLGDALASANTARAEADARVERLDAALRAGRGPSGPVPEGERALRAEVIGLRRRLEESGAEVRQSRDRIDALATELAIARAHREDRQHEIDQQRERLEALARERAAQVERLDEALARQRELLSLVSRVQAENVELRSTQAALEETLEARDLEISAREEHLQATRRGLAARDTQLIDAEERLEQARHRRELLETELERARRAQAEQEDRVQRRESRIASLSTTLARIEEAIGRPAPRAPADADANESIPRARSTAPLASPPGPTRPADSAALGAAAAAAPAPTSALAEPAALSPTFPRWRDEKLHALDPEASSVAGFLARRLVAALASPPPQRLRIASLGGARPDAEVELAQALVALGLAAPSIHVFEASAAGMTARRQAVDAAGLADSITISSWADPEQSALEAFHALLLADALFGQPDPAGILDRLAGALESDGVVLFADRISGGPLALSEATLEKLAELWQVLPETWTARAEFAAVPTVGEDGGAPAPMADPIAALLARFTPRATAGFGHLADLAVGPARGAALSEPGTAAEAFLTSIDALDESRSILESLPPRHGVAVLARGFAETPDESSDCEVLGLGWGQPGR